jgi:hypothetical protein
MDPKDRVETLIKTKTSAMQEKMSGHDEPPGAKYRVDQAQVETIIQNWPAAPKKIAEETVRRYGLPNEATPTLLIWHNNGPWKRTEITSDETVHNFPTPHTDYITQKISYHVPVEKLAEVGAFDGSVIVYRTAGEVSATCDNEAANLLSMNLMHDIVQGRRTVEAARKEFAEQTAAWAMNRPAPYAEKLHFDVPASADTADPDESEMAGPMAHQTMEKVKDTLNLGEAG